MKKILLFLFLVGVASSMQAQQSFNDLLNLFEKPNQLIPEALAKKYFGFEPNPVEPTLSTGHIAIKTNEFIALVTHLECGAGGICEISTLTFFDLQGNPLGEIPYDEKKADCTMTMERKSILTTDSLLVFYNLDEELMDCEQDSLKYRKISMEFYPIYTNGRLGEPVVQQVNWERTYYETSCYLLRSEKIAHKPTDTLATMRNEIFASYGYIFKNKKWREYFSKQPWYEPRNKEHVLDQLSIIERKNVDLLLSFEQKK